MKKESVFLEVKQLNENLYKILKIVEGQNETNITIENLNELFRVFHTLKGLFFMVNMEEAGKLMHSAEKLLKEIRKGSGKIEEHIIEILHTISNLINQYYDKGEPDKGEGERLTEQIENLLSTKKWSDDNLINTIAMKLPGEIKESLTDIELSRIGLNVKSGRNIYLANMAFEIEHFEKNIKDIKNKIAKEGELITSIPGELKDNNKKIEFGLLIAHEKSEKHLREMLNTKRGTIKTLIMGEKKKEKNTPPSFKETLSPILKIPSEKIEHLLGDVDEIDDAKNRLSNRVKDLTSEYIYEKLEFSFSTLQKKVNTLYKDIVNLRLVSLWPLLQLIENTIRSTASMVNKKVKLEIKGASTKIDRPIIDILVEPMIHLVRNAIDHGIEPPEERKLKGKSETGTIKIECYQSENSVFIDLSDDGAGIDLEKVKKRAKELGLTKLYSKLTEEQLLQFIFHQGFSTKSEASYISGRGVGLETVKGILTSIGGDIYVKTVKDKGTTFTLKLPLTTAIMPMFFVNIDDFIVCFPEFSVEKIEEYEETKMKLINDKSYYLSEGQPIPLINLPQLINRITLFSKLSIVVTVNFANTTVCVLVDEIIDHDERKIMPFKGKLEKVPLFSAICRYSENRIGYVLDMNQLIDFTRKKYETKLKLRTIAF